MPKVSWKNYIINEYSVFLWTTSSKNSNSIILTHDKTFLMKFDISIEPSCYPKCENIFMKIIKKHLYWKSQSCWATDYEAIQAYPESLKKKSRLSKNQTERINFEIDQK